MLSSSKEYVELLKELLVHTNPKETESIKENIRKHELFLSKSQKLLDTMKEHMIGLKSSYEAAKAHHYSS